MPVTNVQDWIELADFSAGIHDDHISQGFPLPAPDGAAQVTDTWGCIADHTGTLIPAPASVHELDEAGLLETAGTYPASDAKNHIVALKAVPYVSSRVGSVTETDFKEHLFFGFAYFFDPASGTAFQQRLRVRSYKAYKSGTYHPISINTAAINQANFLLDSYGYITFDLSRSNKSAETTPGYPVLGILATPYYAPSSMSQKAYPDNDTPTVDSNEDMNLSGITSNVLNLIAHQDRFVGTRYANAAFGTDGDILTDDIVYTKTNDYSESGGSPASFVSENPSRVGVWASMNAGELFVVKHAGGGYVARGDILNPQISRLPSLPSIDGLGNLPALTPKGLVYGTRHGVWLWNGGDVAQPASPKLMDDFWNHSDIDGHLPNVGQFAFSNPFVFAPNNWLMDIRNGSWWRLLNPTVRRFFYWSRGSSGRIIGAPAYLSATQLRIAEWFDVQEGCNEFSWRSHPLARTRNRVHNFREINLTIQGEGAIEVTLYGLDDETVTETFECNDPDTPITIRKTTQMKAHDVQVKIHSKGANAAPAPRVHRISLGLAEREGVAK